ncbi:MAG TPA: PIG-L family deacetylase [Verrucomicrobiales bacterium]|nr:PIG-L family deacetylase [Verrucomicrobiales bacterium]
MFRPVALAVVAHPDDIEFVAAGTMLLLARNGWDLHYLTLAGGDCGSVSAGPEATLTTRAAEAREAAQILGAAYHPSLTRDLQIFYELPLLRRLAAIIRTVRPGIILTHSPEDYMEDHMNTARLTVTAAFARGMPNFTCEPSVDALPGDVAIYHAMPHGLCDGLRRPVLPDAFVDTSPVHQRKRRALAAHRSQKEWLDHSQGMDSYLKSMDDMSLAIGRMSGVFTHAEGWRRHSHLGFSAHEEDPLAEALGPQSHHCRNGAAGPLPPGQQAAPAEARNIPLGPSSSPGLV